MRDQKSDLDRQAWLVRGCLAGTVGMMVLFAADIGRDIYQDAHRLDPGNFLWDGRTAPQPMTALTVPIVDEAGVLKWAVRAVLAPYSVNYADYAEQLNAAGTRFIPHAWNTFALELQRTGGNLEMMKRARIVCYAQTQREALVRQVSVIDGRLSYDIQFPILQTCGNTQGQSTTRLMITADVVRTDIQQHPEGLAIDRLVGE